MNQYLYRLLPARVEMVTIGPTPEEQAIVSEHFAHLEALTEQGVMLFVGRTQDNSPRTFGIAVFQAESEEQARAIMNGDPAVRKGIMHADLFPFRIALVSLAHRLEVDSDQGTDQQREEANRQLIIELWQRMGRFDFASAGELLHDDYACEWPQSQERIHGREDFVALNANYPGRWAAEVKRVIVEGDRVASEVALTWENQTVVVVSFYEIRDGKIYREVDYWPEPYAAPGWRAQWVERM